MSSDPAAAGSVRIDAGTQPPAVRVAGGRVSRGARRPGKGRGFGAGAALAALLAAGGGQPLGAQAPRAGFAYAIRVSAYVPVRELAHDSLKVASLGAAPTLGLALTPARGPLQRLFLEAGPAMLRVDPGGGCTELAGFACASETVYGFTASAAAETGVHRRLGRSLLAYALLGPALRLYGFRNDFACIPEAVLCTTAARYGKAGLGVGGHAALGLRRAAPGRHLSTEAAATLMTYPGARTQLDLGVSVAFPF